MARRGGRRGSRGRSSSRRSRGKTGGVGSSRSKSKSNKSKSTGGSRGRSSNTRGGQSKANRNQNKKARRTVKSVKKAASRVAKGIGASFKGAAANAASAVANSSLASKYNRKTRDMSKLTPQSRRRYERLAQKTGRDYSQRIPTMRINLSADRLAQFGKFQDSGWYKGLTNRFPGIRKLQINKQLYSNPMKKGWHSSQRTGRGQGIKDIPMRDMMMRPEDYKRQDEAVQRQYDYDRKAYDASQSAMRGIRRLPRGVHGTPARPSQRPAMGPQQDWLGSLYSSHNISGGKLDQGARDYWSNEAKTKGRDAVTQSIIGTSKAEGTYGGRKKPQSISTGSRRRGGGGIWGLGVGLAGRGLRGHVDRKGSRKNLAKTLAASTAALGLRGG